MTRTAALLLLAGCATARSTAPAGAPTTFIVQFENIHSLRAQHVECVVDGQKAPPAWLSDRVTCFEGPLTEGEHRFAMRTWLVATAHPFEGYKIDLKSNQSVTIGAKPVQVTALIVGEDALENRCGDLDGPKLSWDIQHGPSLVRATQRPPEPPTAELKALRHQNARTNYPLAPEELVDLLDLARACTCDEAVPGLQAYLRAHPNLIDAAEPSAAVGALRHCGAEP